MTPLPPETSLPQALPDGTPWPQDAVEVARVVDAWGVKGGIKLQPFSSDPQALFCTKRWYVLPAVPQAGARRPMAGAPGVAATSSSASLPARSGAATQAAKAPARLAEPTLLRVKTAKEQGDIIVATIDGLDDRNAAEALKGARVFVSRSAFPTPDEDEYYWVDLIGLDVVNREGQALGRVVDLLDTGPHCVLRCVLTQDDGPQGEVHPEPQERLIPFVSAYIDRVSLAERLIVADWGLDF